MMFEGVPQFWRDHESLNDLQERGIEPSEVDETSFWETIRPMLVELPTAKWLEIVSGQDLPALNRFAEVMNENKADAIATAGKAKYARIRGWLGAVRTLRRPLVRIDEPLHVVTLQALNKSRNPLAPPLSDRQLGRMLGRDGKTIKRWRESMAEAGPPPKDGWLDYFRHIVKPPRTRGEEPPSS